MIMRSIFTHMDMIFLEAVLMKRGEEQIYLKRVMSFLLPFLRELRINLTHNIWFIPKIWKLNFQTN